MQLENFGNKRATKRASNDTEPVLAVPKIKRKNREVFSPKALTEDVVAIGFGGTRKRYSWEKPKNILAAKEESPKVKRPRKKIESPAASNLDLTPVDEREDFDHTKKTIKKPYWKVPENIPMEPENFDEITLADIVGKETKSFDEITEKIQELEQDDSIKLIEETIPEDPYDTYDRYEDNLKAAETADKQAQEYLKETPGDILEDKHRNEFHAQQKKPWENNPSKITGRQYFDRSAHPGTPYGKENLKTIPEYKQARRFRGFLSNLKQKIQDYFIQDDLDDEE